MVDLARELKVAINTGKVVLGSRQTIKAILRGEAKAVVVAANIPNWIKDDVEYYAKLAQIPVIVYPGSSWELGAACGKPFKVSTLAIIDPGESAILELARG
ncbi:MAG: 50S ribosomal protein L30e [Crenarchaeota archaeon]|nr:50S ribosomal protein L30e [Thermoproteota archaeon]